MGLVTNFLKAFLLAPILAILLGCRAADIHFSEPALMILNPEEAEYCEDWILSREQVREYFSEAELIEPVSTREYYFGACELKGEGEINGKPFTYSINVGGVGRIVDEEKETLYGCKLRCKEILDFGFYEYGDERDFK